MMNYVPPPISYAKVNPLGQLVIGLENGTILNAGTVVGRQGIQGPTGYTGMLGPTGPVGPYVTNMYINEKGDLIYSLNNNTYKFNAGKVPGYTGPQGPRGNSITNCTIRGNILEFLLDDNTLLTAGNVLGPTGLRGPCGQQGIQGPTGPMGKPFKATRIFTSNDVLFILDDDNTIHSCGYIGVTGPPGPVSDIQSITIDESGHLIFKGETQTFNAGYVQGPQGSIGPTGPKGRPGPMLRLKDIHVTDVGELVFTDEYEKIYNTGVLPIISKYETKFKELEQEILDLKNKISLIENLV